MKIEMGKREGENREGEARTGLPRIQKNTKTHTQEYKRIQKEYSVFFLYSFVFLAGRLGPLSLVLQSCFVLFSLASLSSLVSAFVRLGLCASGFLGICACRPLGVWPLASGPVASGPLASGPLGLY